MRALVSTLMCAFVLAAQPESPAQSELDFARIAEALVQRMSLRPGERVLLVGAPGRFDALVPQLRAAIAATGAVDLGAVTATGEALAGEATAFVTAAAGLGRARLAEVFRDVDLAVMLPGANVPDPPYAAMQDVLRSGRGRTIHFHWLGAYDTEGNAIEVTPRVDAVYQRALLDTDHTALASAQSALESAMRTAEVHVTTPHGTDLRFRVGDRPVTRQDGDASAARASAARNLIDREVELPAGAIRVAPLEESVNGVIAIPASTWSDRTVRGLVLRFERGRIVDLQADEGRDVVEAELAAGGEGARAFREFALGMNPLLAVPEEDPWIPYYGYGAGVVRLSLGDNLELGGAVSGGSVRWNFFIDATVRVGEEIWVERGRLLRSR